MFLYGTIYGPAVDIYRQSPVKSPDIKGIIVVTLTFLFREDLYDNGTRTVYISSLHLSLWTAAWVMLRWNVNWIGHFQLGSLKYLERLKFLQVLFLFHNFEISILFYLIFIFWILDTTSFFEFQFVQHPSTGWNIQHLSHMKCNIIIFFFLWVRHQGPGQR